MYHYDQFWNRLDSHLKSVSHSVRRQIFISLELSVREQTLATKELMTRQLHQQSRQNKWNYPDPPFIGIK